MNKVCVIAEHTGGSTKRVSSYLNILQLGLHSRAVFCSLDGLALEVTQHGGHALQFGLWTKRQRVNPRTETHHLIGVLSVRRYNRRFHEDTGLASFVDHNRESDTRREPRTCTLASFSACSSLWRSLSECLSSSSWTWASAFFRRCSESPFPCISVCISMASSFLSDSRACLAFSMDTLFCGR